MSEDSKQGPAVGAGELVEEKEKPKLTAEEKKKQKEQEFYENPDKFMNVNDLVLGVIFDENGNIQILNRCRSLTTSREIQGFIDDHMTLARQSMIAKDLLEREARKIITPGKKGFRLPGKKGGAFGGKKK